MDFRVTRALLVGPTRPENRLPEERRILAEHFPSFRLTEVSAPDQCAAVTGRLSTFAGKSYAIRVVLHKNYPHELPHVLPDGWTPRRNVHTLGKRLCVMRDSQWQAYMSVAFLVSKTALWLNKYEVFLGKGVWPGPEQHEHGTLYNMKKWWYDL